jgi:hypothetical protein
VGGILHTEPDSGKWFRNRPSLTVILLLGLALAAIAIGPSASRATTGPTPLAYPPRFKITKAQAAPYLGHFKLAKPLGRQLISGAYVGGHNDKGFVEGNLVVYAYDAEGRESSWLGRTYEYHAVGDEMIVDVISPDNEEIFARMRLHPVRGGRLTGSLKMRIPPGPSQRISFAPISFPNLGAGPNGNGSTGEAAPSAEKEGTTDSPPSSTPKSSVAELVLRLLSF